MANLRALPIAAPCDPFAASAGALGWVIEWSPAARGGVAREQDQTDSIDVPIRAFTCGRRIFHSSIFGGSPAASVRCHLPVPARDPVERLRCILPARGSLSALWVPERNGWGPMALHNSYAVRHPVRGMVVNLLLAAPCCLCSTASMRRS